jgi:acetyl/propionyl-CoA carboxylase alpha subunit
MARYYVQIDGRELAFDIVQRSEDGMQGVQVRPLHDDARLPEGPVDFAPVQVSPQTGEGLYSLIVGGKSYQLYVEHSPEGYRVALWRYRFDMKVLNEREWRLQKIAPRQAAHAGRLVVPSPMPGLVKEVLVEVGQQVNAGQRLVVLEAMKMENDIIAPRAGVITQVHVQPGTVVEGGKPLVILE